MRVTIALCLLAAAAMSVDAGQRPPAGGSVPRPPTFRAGGGRTGGGQRPEPAAVEPAPAGFSDALDVLTRIRRTAAVRSLAGWAWHLSPEGAPQVLIWVNGELDQVVATNDARWEDGGKVAVEVEGPEGTPLDTRSLALDRDARFFSVRLVLPRSFAPGDYYVRVTAVPSAGKPDTAETFFLSVPRLDAAAAGPIGQPQLARRGPFSGPDWEATGDLRFRRQERVRVETTVAGEVTASGVKLLDRAAHPLPLPATASARFDAGITTVSGEVTLAPLGAGEYVLETTIARGAVTERRYTAIRIVP